MMITLLDLKNRKAVLQSCMEIEKKADGEVSEKTFKDYKLVLTQLRFAEIQLLKPFNRYNRCRWLLE